MWRSLLFSFPTSLSLPHTHCVSFPLALCRSLALLSSLSLSPSLSSADSRAVRVAVRRVYATGGAGSRVQGQGLPPRTHHRQLRRLYRRDADDRAVHHDQRLAVIQLLQECVAAAVAVSSLLALPWLLMLLCVHALLSLLSLLLLLLPTRQSSRFLHLSETSSTSPSSLQAGCQQVRLPPPCNAVLPPPSAVPRPPSPACPASRAALSCYRRGGCMTPLTMPTASSWLGVCCQA